MSEHERSCWDRGEHGKAWWESTVKSVRQSEDSHDLEVLSTRGMGVLYAADRIEALEKESATLRAALKDAVEEIEDYRGYVSSRYLALIVPEGKEDE